MIFIQCEKSAIFNQTCNWKKPKMSEKTGPGRQKSLYIPEKNGESKTDEAQQRMSKE